MPATAGIVNATAAPVIPLPGLLRVPFRYFQSTYVPSAALATYNATQSPAFPGPSATVAVTFPPTATLVELSVIVGRPGGPLTVTVAVAVTEPAELVAVTVYVVVAVGLTDLVPDAVTVPMLWSIETVVAFVLDQVSVDAAPDVIEVGEALIVTVGDGGGAPVDTI